MSLHWDDQKLVYVKGDTHLRRRYRRLQSWYRDEVLGLPPGLDTYGIPRGNWLPAEAVAADPSLNFLRSAQFATIAEDRIAESKGTVGVDRLRRNLLSSQPLAVNLFGPLLGADPQRAAAILQEALHLDMATISNVRIEWAPEPAEQYLADRTAFDVYFEYQREGGPRGFVAIETKYTDSFSSDDEIRKSEEKRAKYTQHAQNLDEYDDDRIAELFHPKVSQLFRMALLASLWRIEGGFSFGHCVVACLADDADATEAVDRLTDVHDNSRAIVRKVSHEDLVAALERLPEVGRWGTDFRQRYLDHEAVG